MESAIYILCRRIVKPRYCAPRCHVKIENRARCIVPLREHTMGYPQFFVKNFRKPFLFARFFPTRGNATIQRLAAASIQVRTAPRAAAYLMPGCDTQCCRSREKPAYVRQPVPADP